MRPVLSSDVLNEWPDAPVLNKPVSDEETVATVVDLSRGTMITDRIARFVPDGPANRSL